MVYYTTNYANSTTSASHDGYYYYPYYASAPVKSLRQKVMDVVDGFRRGHIDYEEARKDIFSLTNQDSQDERQEGIETINEINRVNNLIPTGG